MFLFKKKSAHAVDLSEVRADMHSHLLPGIDDGAVDLVNSIDMIQGLQDLGYQNLITTPHIMWDMYKNDESIITSKLIDLKAEMVQHKQSTSLQAAAEYYLDEHFDMLLQNKIPLLTIKDNLVLVELPFINQPINAKQKFFQLQINGYRPVLAHPERYHYLAGNKKLFEELKYAGCLFQINILSLCHYYGKIPYDLAHYLIKNDYVELIGTDLHHQRHLEVLRSSPQIISPIKMLLDSGKLLNPTL